MRALLSSFPSNTDGMIVVHLMMQFEFAEAESSKINDDSENTFLNWSKNILGARYLNTDSVKRFIHTRVGDGASSANDAISHLADEATGMPKEKYWLGQSLLKKKRDVVVKLG